LPGGIEIDAQYFALAKKAVPQLTALYPAFQGETTEFQADYAPALPEGDQLALALADQAQHVLPSTKPRAGRAFQPLSCKKPATAASGATRQLDVSGCLQSGIPRASPSLAPNGMAKNGWSLPIAV